MAKKNELPSWGPEPNPGDLPSWGETPAEQPAPTPPPRDEGTLSGGEGFWSKAEEKEKRARTPRKAASAEEKRERKSNRRMIILGGGAFGLLFLLFVGFLLTPTIAERLAPGIIKKRAAQAISGTVEVDECSFSWFAGQRLGPVRILDPKGKEVASLTVETSAGLFGLATGDLDLGEVNISGRAMITRARDGATNLEQTVAPPPGAPKPAPGKREEPAIPPALAAKVRLSNIKVAYVDESGAEPIAVVIDGVRGEANYRTGSAMTFKLTADAGEVDVTAVRPGSIPPTEPARAGQISVEARVSGIAADDGKLTPRRTSVDATLRGTDLPMALIDALAAQQGRLVAGLGDRARFELTIDGGLSSAKIDLRAASTAAGASRARVDAALSVTDHVLTTRAPIVVVAPGATLAALVPAVRQAMDGGDVLALDALPDSTFTVENVRLPLPESGSLDLRHASLSAVLDVGAARGTLRLQPGEAPRPLDIMGLRASIRSSGLGESVRFETETRAMIDGKPAGAVEGDITASGLLDENGALVLDLPSRIAGTLSVRGVTSALAQPFVDDLGLDLPQDLGPTIDLELTAVNRPADTKAGEPEHVQATLTLRSENVQVSAPLDLARSMVRARDQGVRIELKQAGRIASRFMPADGWRFLPAGTAAINVKELFLPRREADGAILLSTANVKVDLISSGLSLAPSTPGASPLALRTLNVSAVLSAAGPPKVFANSNLAFDGAPFSLVGNLDIPGILAPTPAVGAAPAYVDLGAARPRGKVELRDLPMALAALVLGSENGGPAPGDKPASGLDLVALLEDAVGPRAGVTIEFSPSAKVADGFETAVAVRSEHLNADARADVSSKRLEIAALRAESTAQPRVIDTLLRTFVPDLESRPALARPATLRLTVDPLAIPLLDAFAPDLAGAGTARLTLEIPEPALVAGLRAAAEDGTTRVLPTMGLENARIVVTAPLAAFAEVPPAGGVARTQVTLAGRFLSSDPPGSRVAVLSASGSADIRRSALAGPSSFTIAASDLNVRALERILGKDGLLVGALGDTARLDASAELTPSRPREPSSPPNINLQVTLAAPRVTMDEPIKLAVLQEKIELREPARLSVEVEPAWLDKFVFAPPPGQAQGARVSRPARVDLSLGRLIVARPGEREGRVVGPLLPGVFEAESSLSIGNIDLGLPDNQSLRLAQVVARVVTDRRGESLSTSLNVGRAELRRGAELLPGVDRMNAQFSIASIADAQGNPTPERAVLTGQADMPGIPTSLIDTLANQKGLLVEALGPTVEFKISADRVSASGDQVGTITASAKSDRANASLRGKVQEGLFIAEGPVEVNILVITPELSRTLVKQIPSVGEVQKTGEDRPAIITSANLRAPVDGNMSRLNADVRIDPGEARFTTSDIFSKFLRPLRQREAGRVGQRMDPLDVTIRNGVATYPRYFIPIGEFRFATEGEVNLVTRQLDIVTWIPAGALTTEAVSLFTGGLSTILGGRGQQRDTVVDALTMLPFRTRGSFDGTPDTRPDIELYARNLIDKVNPFNIIRDIIRPPPPQPDRR